MSIQERKSSQRNERKRQYSGDIAKYEAYGSQHYNNCKVKK